MYWTKCVVSRKPRKLSLNRIATKELLLQDRVHAVASRYVDQRDAPVNE